MDDIETKQSIVSTKHNEKKYHNFVNVVGDAGLSIDTHGLIIDNKEFTRTILPGKDGAGDHVKFLMEIKDVYNIPKTSAELLYTVKISAKQYFRNTSSPAGVIPSPFIARVNNIMADPRLCCSAITVFDDSTMMVYKTLLTNRMFYAYYGRRPNLKTSWVNGGPSQGEYASFASMVPLLSRGDKDVLNTSEGPLNDFNIVSIGFKYDNVHDRYQVTWYIDGVNVLSINQLGYRLSEQYQVFEQGGHQYRVGIGSLRFGIGHFSFLDYQLPNNYAKEHVYRDESQRYPIVRSSSGLVQLCPFNFYREVYPNFTGEHPDIIPKKSFAISIEESFDDENSRLFGQGMVTRISWMTVLIRETKGYIISSPVLPVISDNSDESSSYMESRQSDQSGRDIRRVSDVSDISNEPTIRKISEEVDTNDPSEESLISLVSDDSLETMETIDGSLVSLTSDCSLETIPPSRPKINDACRICHQRCNARCCNGRCGSRSCKQAAEISRTITKVKSRKPTKQPCAYNTSKLSSGRSIQIARSLNHYS